MALAGVRWGNVSAAAIETPLQPAIQAPTWALPDLAGRLVELSASAESSHLTAAVGLVLEAQLGDDRAAWVTLDNSSFFPPDVLDTGIDLDAMPVVRVANAHVSGRAADHLLRSGGFGLVVIDLSAQPDIQGRCRSRPTQSDAIRARVKPARKECQRARAISGPVGVPRQRQFARGTDEAQVSSVVSAEAAGVATPLNVGLPVPILSRLLGLARQHDAVVLLLTRKTEDAPSMHSLISLRAEARWQWTGEGVYELCVRVLKDKRGGPGWTHVEICRGPDGLR